MEDYLRFRKMITPLIIQVLFWIGVVVSIVAGILTIISGAQAPVGGGMMIFSGIVWLFLGPLVTRIYCELVIIFFSINQNILEVRKALEKDESGEEKAA